MWSLFGPDGVPKNGQSFLTDEQEDGESEKEQVSEK